MSDKPSRKADSATIISLAERLEQAAQSRNYGALSDLDAALRSQASALASGRHTDAVDRMAVGALWTALGAVQRASETVSAQKTELQRKQGRARTVHLSYTKVDKP